MRIHAVNKFTSLGGDAVTGRLRRGPEGSIADQLNNTRKHVRFADARAANRR